MMQFLDRLSQKALFCLDPETAHGLSIAALKSGVPLGFAPPDDRRLSVNAAGIDFPNPLGMAAGYDKNAEVPDALLRLGFGFAEIGTVTPLPQPGNPRPRIFRLTADRAVINRLGFNNEGHEPAFARLRARAGRGGVVGVNIGANKDSADRIGDYARGAARFAALASYLTVNVSSPNTPGLRNLQSRESLRELLARVRTARDEALAGSAKRTPVFLKIAPDLSATELAEIAEEVLANGTEGVIVSNTTLSRDGLRSAAQHEAGGLSGAPLLARSTAVLARMRRLLGPQIAIIGVGGVDSAGAAIQKIRAGADLVQLYTSMIYAGPGLPARIVRGLSDLVDRQGLASISALRDCDVEEWAARPI
jgi:dihydroorotate dehydrogenase